VSHCPSSNAFLGSGLFPLGRHVRHGVKVGMGTDVGAGTSYSMFQEMNAAYKTQALQIFGLDRSADARKMGGVRLLYLATLAGARVLGLEDETGCLLPGRSADFIVVDPSLDPIVRARLDNSRDPREALFVLAITGDRRLISQVYLSGLPAWTRPSRSQ
jgi:guanine deaminase